MNRLTYILVLLMAFALKISAQTTVHEPYKTLEGPEKDVDVVIFHPDGDKLYAGGWDNKVFIYEWPSGTLINSFNAHHSAVLDIQFSKDGSYFMTASNDNTARLWRTSDNELLHTLRDHKRPVNSAAISPDNRFVITASDDGDIHIYDRNDDFRKVSTIELSGDDANYVTFEPQRGMIAKATSRHTAHMVQPGTFNAIRDFSHNAGVNHIFFMENGSRVITASDDRTAIVWDPVEDRKVVTLEGHGWRVLSAYMDESGEFAVTSSNDGTARLWDVGYAQTLRIFEPEPPTVIRSAVISPDLEYVITTGRIRQPGQAGIMIWESGLFDEEETEDDEGDLNDPEAEWEDQENDYPNN